MKVWRADVARRVSSGAWPVVAAVALVLLLFVAMGQPPFRAAKLMWEGAVGDRYSIGNTLMAWVPLVLAAAGLVVTFAAGLWNIGVEGQVVVGAIAATFVAREMPGPSIALIPACLVAGMAGGVLWAALVGVLKTRGKVNEIFGGLGLDFVASGLAVYLIIGPWKRAGIASTSGTDLFREQAHLPTFANTTLSFVAVGLAIAGVVAVYLLMRGTLFGLRLKAVGRNPRSAFLMGIPTERYVIGAFAICGALAWLAGAIQAIGVWHKLVPSISGGYGFLGILVVLLAGFSAVWIAPIALFFVMISVGATQLTLWLGLHSAIGGVIQGLLVLFVILGGGWQVRRRRARQGTAEGPSVGEGAPGGPAPVEQVEAGV